METPLLILVIVAPLVVIALVFLWSRRREAERTAAIERLALTLGLHYEAKAGLQALEGFSHLRLFAQGRLKKIRHLMTGSWRQGTRKIFDYRYTVGGGKNSQTRRQTVVVYELERDLPGFELRPENVFHKIGSALGYQDFDFEGSPEFSKRYLLRGADETAVRSLFGPSARYHFERHLGWSIEGDGRWVVLYRDSKRVTPGELSAFLEATEASVRALEG